MRQVCRSYAVEALILLGFGYDSIADAQEMVLASTLVDKTQPLAPSSAFSVGVPAILLHETNALLLSREKYSVYKNVRDVSRSPRMLCSTANSAHTNQEAVCFHRLLFLVHRLAVSAEAWSVTVPRVVFIAKPWFEPKCSFARVRACSSSFQAYALIRLGRSGCSGELCLGPVDTFHEACCLA